MFRLVLKETISIRGPRLSCRIHNTHVKSNKCSLGSQKSGGKHGPGGEHDLGAPDVASKLVRRTEPGKVRFGFISDDWFKFFYPKTGVSGGFLFFALVTNYCLSKEIYVMEHEYYNGLSLILIIILATKNIGPKVAASLDKEVAAVAASFENGLLQSKKVQQDYIKALTETQLSALGQVKLMDAKKDNIKIQLEAAYRERFMLVYNLVRWRMEYHVKKYYTEGRIEQKWMAAWILKEVYASITPEFKQQAMQSAIADLSAVANKS